MIVDNKNNNNTNNNDKFSKDLLNSYNWPGVSQKCGQTQGLWESCKIYIRVYLHIYILLELVSQLELKLFYVFEILNVQSYNVNTATQQMFVLLFEFSIQ